MNRFRTLIPRCRRLQLAVFFWFFRLAMIPTVGAGASSPDVESDSTLRVWLRSSSIGIQGSFQGMDRRHGADALLLYSNGDTMTIPGADIRKLEVKTGTYSGQEVKAPFLFTVALAGAALGSAYWAGSTTDGSTALKVLAGLGGSMVGLEIFGKVVHETWPTHARGDSRWKTVPLPE